MPYIVLIVLLIAGCYPSASNLPANNQNQLKNLPSIQLNNSFSLKVNQVALIESENLELKLLEVRKDSRCPATAQCIWAGLVEIIVKARKNGRDIDLTLIDRGDNNQSTTKVFDNYAIKLIEVTPYPQNQGAINQKDYSAKFIVSRP
jgi:hypothetical protein